MEKLSFKEKRQRWKEAKRAKRQELKEYYTYAPWIVRVWNLYLKMPVCIILALFVLVMVIFTNIGIFEQIFYTKYFDFIRTASRTGELTEEQKASLYEASPIDEEGAARIDALPGTGKDETWTICLYIIGSDLEDYGKSEMSELARYQTQLWSDENEAKTQQDISDNIFRYLDELAYNGLEAPSYFYRPDIASDDGGGSGIEFDLSGSASDDIEEITSGVWSDNIRIVIQTCGAGYWKNRMINPNRIQRFEYYKGNFNRVADLPLQDAASPEGLSDFLKFCKDNYRADHNMLVLWNHGMGPFGFGYDAISRGSMDLSDLRSALSKVYSPNIHKPAFDIIGFDACLMSTIEVTHALYGFGKYYCLSEEIAPGDGWDYKGFLGAMTDDPTMSPARVARAVTDTYSDFFVAMDIRVPGTGNDVTMSVVDAEKAEELYNAYCDLAKTMLKDSAENPLVLVDIGRCANNSTMYGTYLHNIFNTVDLGNYVDYMVDYYPEQCSDIKKLIGETVLYHRQNGAMSDSAGIAVYIPADVSTIEGLAYFLQYVYNDCQDENTAALYYYKQAGCLTDEMLGTLSKLTDVAPVILDVAPFKEFESADPQFDNAGFVIPIADDLQNMIVDHILEVTSIDEKNNKLICYGKNNSTFLDGEGRVLSSFDGKWIHLKGVPLYIEPVSTSMNSELFRSHIYYNGAEAYLLISRDLNTDTLSISGMNYVSDDANYMIPSRADNLVEEDARITPIYEIYNLDTKDESYESGETIKYSGLKDLELKNLKAGNYLADVIIKDQRGDSYFSKVMSFEAGNNGAGNWHTEEKYYGRDY